MDGTAVMEFAQSFLDQDQDIAFGFTANEGRFVVVGFSANEAVNAPFEIKIELASEDADIDLHALMDTQACLGVYDKYDAPRFLNGIITEVSRGDSGIRRTFYTVTLRPALQRLAHTSDSRIWQNKTVSDIIKQVLEEHNIINVDWLLAGTHEPREYCTQYRETALEFVERLLGEEGIFYFFEHSTDAHTLIITDAPLATPVLAAAPLITYNAQSGGQLKGSAISAFSQHERLRSSNYEMSDYTFKNPTARMNESRIKQEDNGLSADYKLYDYPGRYKNPSTVGGNFTQHRMESVRVDATTGQGVTNNIHLCAGFHFSISDHDDAKVNASHFLLSVRHSGSQSAALQEDSTALTFGEDVSHSVAFRGMTTNDTMLIASGNDETIRPIAPKKFTSGADDLRDHPHQRVNLSHGRAAEKGSLLVHSGADMMLSSDGEFQVQSDKSLRLTSLETMNLTTPSDLKVSAQDKVIVEASNGIAVSSPSGIVLQSGASKITLAADGKINIEGSVITVKGSKICLN